VAWSNKRQPWMKNKRKWATRAPIIMAAKIMRIKMLLPWIQLAIGRVGTAGKQSKGVPLSIKHCQIWLDLPCICKQA
jgi:hypothetical protein